MLHQKMIKPGKEISKENQSWTVFPGLDESTNNAYFWARKSFNVDNINSETLLHICAQARYILYLNGELIGQGPAKASDLTAYYDTYDISELLKQGDNSLALEIHYPGDHFRTCSPGVPGFWCEISADIPSWKENTWQVCADPSRIDKAQEFTFQAGYTNFRDLRKIPEGWQCFSDESSSLEWKVGTTVSNLNDISLTSRDIPALTMDFVEPAKLVEAGTIPATTGKPEEEDFAAITSSEPHTENTHTFEPETGEIKSLTNGDGVYLIYDFEREVYGNPVLEITAPNGAVLDITYGEMLEDGRLEAYYPFGQWKPKAATTADGYRFADRHILTKVKNMVEVRLQDRGCRYVQLNFRNFGKSITLSKFGFENRIYPVGDEGQFSCTNEYFNKLWQVCSHTVRHCLDDSFVDCPWREQAFWINDFLVSNVYYFNLTADPALPRHCFDLAADGCRKFGFLPAVYPAGDPLFFPSMPALWTLTLYDYYMFTGDEKGREELLESMDLILSTYDKLANEDGLIPNHDTWWNFIDIGFMDAKLELKGCTSILNSLVAAAFKCAAELHSGAMAEKYAQRSGKIIELMKEKLWDKENKRFRDSTEKGHGFETFSTHTHATLLMYNLIDEWREYFIDALVAEDAVQAEPYYLRFILEALAQNGKTELAEKLLGSVWKNMMDTNAPTIWEIAAKGPKKKGTAQSLCHAFSCAPIAYASRVTAGIIPVKPGFREFSLNPHPGLAGDFICKQPTPYGTIEVKATGNQITATVPKGTTAILPNSEELEAGVHSFDI